MRLAVQLHAWCLVLMEGASYAVVLICFQMVVAQEHREGEQFFDVVDFH